MKIMKKLVSFALAFVVIAAILSGCGSDINKSSDIENAEHKQTLADLETSKIGVLRR